MNLIQTRDEIEPYYAEESVKKHKRNKKVSKKLPKVIQDRILVGAICLTVVLCGISFCLIRDTVKRGTAAANEAYVSTKDDTEKRIYQRFYDAAEAQYHTSNDVSISVDSIREEAKLEVLKVSDVEYIIQEGNKSNNGITSWLEVPGEGVFTVDLQVSEFIIDNKHHYILARIPNPVLSECRVLYQDAVQLEYKNDIFNDSIKVGEDLARKQFKEAYMRIMTEFTSNPNFFDSARSAAETIVVNLIKSFNPDIPDLVVEVNFIE